jgi:hypothetical protein
MSTDEKVKLASHQLRDDVASGLVGCGKKVRAAVIHNLTEKEIAERTSAVLSLFERIGEKEKELRKLESQGVASFDHKGDVVGVPTFTKQQVEEIKKAKEAVERMQAALAKAFDSDDFQKVKELAKNSGGGGGEQQQKA